jgi:nicotinamidase-related amidase
MEAQKTAVILIGYQNDYFSPQGLLNSVIEASAKVTHALENTVSLLEQLASSEVLLISTPIFFTQDYKELTEAVGLLKIIKEVGAFCQGSPGSETVAELLPFQDRILEVPGKRGFNAFVNTNLDQILKDQGITHVALAGAVTSVCLDSTGRFAQERGYQVTMLADCMSARTAFEQEFYCENIFPLYANVWSHSEFLANLAVPAQPELVAA